MSFIQSISPDLSGHATTILRGLGDISGLREVLDRSQIVKVLAFPIEAINDLSGIKAFRTPGCYILSGNGVVYIGETGDLGARLVNHIQDPDKAFANEVFAVSAFDKSCFNKEAARFFEAQLTGDAEAKGLVRVLKGASPPQTCLPAERKFALNTMLSTAHRLLFDAGCRAFASTENSPPPSSNEPVELSYDRFDDLEMKKIESARIPMGARVSELSYTGIWARGYQSQNMFVVLAGSEMRAELNPSVLKIFTPRRDRLIRSGAVVPVSVKPELYRFTVSVAFRSASVAAKTICGASVSANVLWRDIAAPSAFEPALSFADAEDAA